MKKKMSKAEVRVRIAKDVIAQVKVGRFIASTGRYLGLPGGALPDDGYGELSSEVVDVQTVVKDRECRVCALGSLFVAAVDRYNECQLPADDLGNRSPLAEYLARVFTPTQLNKIEAAFEGRSFSHDDDYYGEGFCHAYPDPSKRLVAIMRNIIRNGGTFKFSEVRAPRG